MADSGIPARKNRRALLTVAVVASAAAAGARLVGESTASAAERVPGDPIQAGVVNTVFSDGTKTAGTTTYIASNVPNFSVFNVFNSGGAGSDFAPGIQASGQSLGLAAWAPLSSAPKIQPGEVVGIRTRGVDYGLYANATSGTGVHGQGPSVGVRGDGNEKGVYATGGAFGAYATGATGVFGYGDTYGVDAASIGGTALRALLPNGTGIAFDAQGPVKFSSSGRGAILKDTDSLTITNVNVPLNARLLVTVNGDSGAGNGLRFARRLSNTSFQVKLHQPATKKVVFSYFIIIK